MGSTQFGNGSGFSHDLIMLWANQLIVDWLLINKKIKEVKCYPYTTTKRHMTKDL